MKSIIICVEGDRDRYIINKLLNLSLAPLNINYIVLGGVSALSKIQTLFIRTRDPILLLLDSDSNDSFQVNEKYNFLYDSLNSKAVENKFEIIFFIPEIETIFFKNGVIEDLINRALTEKEKILAEFQPKKVFKELTNISSNMSFEVFLEGKLTADMLRKLRNVDEIKRINSFIEECIKPQKISFA